VLAGCATSVPQADRINPTLSNVPVQPTAGYVYWRLPKTVIEATVTFKLKRCTAPRNGRPQLEVEQSVALVTHGVPDSDIFGPGGPDSLVRVPISALSSFWQDRSLTVHHATDGTLSQLGATSEDQTAAIVGNILTSAVKVASVALGVPAGGPAASKSAGCSPEPARIRAEMDRINAIVRNPRTGQQASAAYNLRLVDLQRRLDRTVIVVHRLIDPGVSPIGCDLDATGCNDAPNPTINAEGLIATILPSQSELVAAGWLTGDAGTQMAAIDDLKISLFLDFSRASPSIIAYCPMPPCTHHRTVIDRTTHFRDVAYIPLLAVRGSDPTAAARSFQLTMNGGRPGTAIPFAQFGMPRSLPISVGIFQRVQWVFNFNEFGEHTDVAFGSAARGVRASQLLQSGAGAASSIAGEQRAADALLPEGTRDLQREITELKAQVDAAALRDQVDLLRAQGKLPQ
jgi:hypothetical protein